MNFQPSKNTFPPIELKNMKRDNQEVKDLLYRPTAKDKRRKARLNDYFSKRFMGGAGASQKQMVTGGLSFSKHVENPYKL